MEKLQLSELDKLHLKNLVDAMEHFKESEFMVVCDSKYGLTNIDPEGYKGVAVLYTGPLANDFMKDNGIDPESLKKDSQGYREFMMNDIEFRLNHWEV